MVLVKYMEFTLAAAFAVLTYSAWLIPLHPPLDTDRDRYSAGAATPVKPMIVVVVTGKRMKPEEMKAGAVSE